ncbi:phage holin family protein [Nitrosomonas eutropha]|nr:phage holin family protein [Nitrosomonas eutropha]PXV82502.1 LydA family holin superfamily III [Nitrosomonas eutropha]
MHHDKDPTTWSIEVWTLAIVMAIVGGLASIIQKLPCERTRPFSALELIGEMITSAFVGMLVFMALEAVDMPLGVCAAGSGVGGHMATRLLFLVENVIEKRIKDMEREK